MAQRISEQVIEYLTVGGDGFTPQTNVPLTINGTLVMNDSSTSYPQGSVWTWPTTWLLTPTNNNFTIAKNNNDQGVFSPTKPSFAINNDEIKIGKKLLISTGSSNGGFYLSYETNSTSIEYGSFYIPTRGTTSTQGIARLEIGNNKQSSTDEDNAQGILRLYSRKQGYSEIYAALDQTTTEKKHYLPDSTGWLVTGGNGFNSGVGSSTEPVFVQTTGVATKCSKYAGGTAVTLNNSNKGAKTASFYAPTTGGTKGYILKANGATATPTWLSTLPIGNGGTGATTAENARINLSTWACITDANYNTVIAPDGTTNGWIKFNKSTNTSSQEYGILPCQNGGAGSGHSSIGTSSWYWKNGYIDNIYGINLTVKQINPYYLFINDIEYRWSPDYTATHFSYNNFKSNLSGPGFYLVTFSLQLFETTNSNYNVPAQAGATTLFWSGIVPFVPYEKTVGYPEKQIELTNSYNPGSSTTIYFKLYYCFNGGSNGSCFKIKNTRTAYYTTTPGHYKVGFQYVGPFADPVPIDDFDN